MKPREFLDLMDELLVAIKHVEANPQISWRMSNWVAFDTYGCEVCLAGAWMLGCGQSDFDGMPEKLQELAGAINDFRIAPLSRSWPFDLDKKEELCAFCVGVKEDADYRVWVHDKLDARRMIRKINVAKAAVLNTFEGGV